MSTLFYKITAFFVKNTASRHKQAVAFQPLTAVVYMKFTALKSIPTVFIAFKLFVRLFPNSVFFMVFDVFGGFLSKF